MMYTVVVGWVTVNVVTAGDVRTTDLTAYTAQELDDLWALVRAEQKRREILATGKTQADAIAAQVAEAVRNGAPRRWADIAPTDSVSPGERVTFTDGTTYRNVSGAWLPITASPATYPLGYVEEGVPQAAKPWGPAATYAKGDRVTRDGKVYECLIAHGPERQGTWGPGPATPTIWRPLA